MKLRRILTLSLACASLGAFAQTHIEGEEYYKADQLENAKDLLQRSLSNGQTDKAVSNYYLGMIAVDQNNQAEAAKYFSAGLAANPQYPYNYVGEGLLKLMQGDQKEAENLFKQADKNSKKDASLQIAIARAYDRVDPVKYEKQIAKQVEKARKFNMENPDIYMFEGDQHRENKDWGRAAGMYEMATNYNPKATAAYVKYANLYTMVNPDFAIKMLGNLLKENPNSALGQRELANAYYNKKEYAKAAAEYGKYVQNPSHFKSDENRYAFLLFYGQDYQKGYDYATKLLKEDPNNFTAQRYQFMNAAQIPEMKDQLLPLAEKLFARYKADPKNNRFAPIDFNLVAYEFQNAGRPDEAIEVLKAGIKEIPDFADFNKTLAMTYIDKNDLTDAADSYAEYMKKIEPGYNDYVQQATFDFYAGIENKNDQAKATKYFEAAKENATKAAEILPENYMPYKIYGDIAKQTAPTADAAESAAVADYEKASDLLETMIANNIAEGKAVPNKYKSDAKDINVYLGNHYYEKARIDEKAKMYYNRALAQDPNNDQLRNFVSKIK
ncbi:MAG: tetratricopeptide repeat protein [Muribaculaceae bacterium]|nr:tetratricopeptide repeat protein [Muribaculaceae bacterium]